MDKRLYQGAAIGFVWLTLLSTLDGQYSVNAAARQPDQAVTMIVRSSPEASFETRQQLRMSGLRRGLEHAVHEKPQYSPLLSDAYIEVPQAHQRRVYRLEQSGRLWDVQEAASLLLPAKLTRQLRARAELLRSRHYGEMVTWQEADGIAPYKGVFTIKDVETGLTFRVQRRAGRDHADVQPLTRSDTKVMKRIYNDRWSWKRKAIIVESQGRRLAASMNGMPHGGDGIPDNGFSGHFCIHFLGSTTHRRDHPDPAHQFMVYKAAGMPNTFLQSASPLVLTTTWLDAINHNESETVRLLMEGLDNENAASLGRTLASMAPMRIIRLGADRPHDDLLTAAVSGQVEVSGNDGSKKRKTLEFLFVRATPHSPWQLQACVAQTPSRMIEYFGGHGGY